jgi:hypothetical protein
MDVYSHVLPALESDAAGKVDGALRRKGFRWWAREVSNLRPLQCQSP